MHEIFNAQFFEIWIFFVLYFKICLLSFLGGEEKENAEGTKTDEEKEGKII